MCGHGAEFREAADNNNQFSSIDGAISEFLLPNTGIIYATRNDALPVWLHQDHMMQPDWL